MCGCVRARWLTARHVSHGCVHTPPNSKSECSKFKLSFMTLTFPPRRARPGHRFVPELEIFERFHGTNFIFRHILLKSARIRSSHFWRLCNELTHKSSTSFNGFNIVSPSRPRANINPQVIAYCSPFRFLRNINNTSSIFPKGLPTVNKTNNIKCIMYYT